MSNQRDGVQRYPFSGRGEYAEVCVGLCAVEAAFEYRRRRNERGEDPPSGSSSQQHGPLHERSSGPTTSQSISTESIDDDHNVMKELHSSNYKRSMQGLLFPGQPYITNENQTAPVNTCVDNVYK